MHAALLTVSNVLTQTPSIRPFEFERLFMALLPALCQQHLTFALHVICLQSWNMLYRAWRGSVYSGVPGPPLAWQPPMPPCLPGCSARCADATLQSTHLHQPLKFLAPEISARALHWITVNLRWHLLERSHGLKACVLQKYTCKI